MEMGAGRVLNTGQVETRLSQTGSEDGKVGARVQEEWW